MRSILGRMRSSHHRKNGEPSKHREASSNVVAVRLGSPMLGKASIERRCRAARGSLLGGYITRGCSNFIVENEESLSEYQEGVVNRIGRVILSDSHRGNRKVPQRAWIAPRAGHTGRKLEGCADRTIGNAGSLLVIERRRSRDNCEACQPSTE